jgi:DNA-binding XRE family transcriptional regulator
MTWKRRRDPETRKLVSCNGDGLKAARKALHLGQIDLADRSEVSKQSIHNYEAGKSVPSLPAALAIIEALGGAERAASALVVGEVE